MCGFWRLDTGVIENSVLLRFEAAWLFRWSLSPSFRWNSIHEELLKSSS